MEHDELEFFNTLTGKLDIKLTEPSEPIGDVTNRLAHPEAQVKSVGLDVQIVNYETGEERQPTTSELKSVALRRKHIRLRGKSGDLVMHTAPNGEYFTVQDLLKAVEETERLTRGNSEFMGGVDIQHCFFEGIRAESEGIWEVCWGS